MPDTVETKIQKVFENLKDKNPEEVRILWEEKLQKYSEEELIYCAALSLLYAVHENSLTPLAWGRRDDSRQNQQP